MDDGAEEVAAAVVWKHYSGEVCLAIWAVAVAGVRVAAGVAADSVAVVLVAVAVAVLEEVSVVVAILAVVAPVVAGKSVPQISRMKTDTFLIRFYL